MLTRPTLDQLQVLGLQGMAKAFTELDKHGDAAALSHAEWLALLLDRETTWRHDERLSARLRHAKLRHPFYNSLYTSIVVFNSCHCNADVTAVRDGVPEIHNAVHCVLILVKVATPVGIKAAKDINQTLRL